MDKKVLDALNNFAYSIEELVDVMQKNIDAKAKQKKTGNQTQKDFKITEHLIAIEEGIKTLNNKTDILLKKHTKKQDEVLSITKGLKSLSEKKVNSTTEGIKNITEKKVNTTIKEPKNTETKSDLIFSNFNNAKKNNSIKDGLKTIILIAGAVLAIGLAFKVVGGVNFASVIALSIAMPLMAIAFEKVSNSLKRTKPSTAIAVGFVLVAMAISTVLASYALQYVKPVQAVQLLTSIGIAAAFAVAAIGIGKLIQNIKNITSKQILMLPFVLVSMAIAIAASSYILQYTKPISLDTMMNVIMVSAALAVVALTLGLGIWVLDKLRIDPKKALMGGLTIIALAGTIVAASFIMRLYNPMPMNNILNMLFFSIGLAVSALVIGIVAVVLNKVGSIKDAIIGGLTILILSGVIMAASLILSYGDYTKFPSLDWALGVGASVLGFGIAAVALGFIMLSGIGAVAMLLGAVTMLGLAGTLVLIDDILQSGSFKTYPPLTWAEGVGKSLACIGGVLSDMGISGVFANILGSAFGNGPEDLATKMLIIDNILKQGDFKHYPPVAWADGVGKALSSIGGVLSNMGVSGVFANILGNTFGSAPEDLAESMVLIDRTLSKGDFRKFPSMQWADGVLMSIVKFNKVRELLEDTDDSDIKITIQNIRSIILQLAGLGIEVGKLTNIPVAKSNSLDTILNMATAYDKLASSLNNLSSSLNNLQQNQLDGLKMLTGNIISLSVIDPENFDKIMDVVKTRSEDLKELFNNITTQLQTSQLQSQTQLQSSSKTVNAITVGNGSSSEKSINDLYDEMVKSNKLLSSISSNMNTVSNFLNEMRSGDVNIKHGSM